MSNKKRRTYVRCSGFALADVLDRLYDDDQVFNLWVSKEDCEFLISFEYIRDYEKDNSKPMEVNTNE